MSETSDGRVDFKRCSEEGCTAKVKNHLWGQIKAEDWLFQKDGRAWCPDHIPSWYEGWRKRKNKK